MTIRSFIALSIPSGTADELGDLAAKLSYQDKSNAVRWVDQENYHITLAFLGEQEQDDLELLAEKLDENLTQSEFRLSLTHPCPFPDNKPKLIATMAKRNDEIDAIYRQINSAIKSVNIAVEKRKFTPHITLGRINYKSTYAGKIPLNVSYETIIDEVVLYKSVQARSGSEYDPIYRFPLDEVPYDAS